MPSIQTRISQASHDRLARLAKQTGEAPQVIVDRALERYERELFLDRMNEGYAELRANEKAWQAEQEERAEWEEAGTDGGEA